MKKIVSTVFLMGLMSTLSAADGQLVEAPPPPPPLVSGEPLQDDQLAPEVTIKEGDKETIYEYRRGGQLIMVRVQPKVGPAYFFFDADGDGQLDYQRSDPREANVNQWKLLTW